MKYPRVCLFTLALNNVKLTYGKVEFYLLLQSSVSSNTCLCVCSVVSDSLQPYGLQTVRLLCPWNFPGKNTGAGCHFLLQEIFPTQGSNPILLSLFTGREILYHCNTWEVPTQIQIHVTTTTVRRQSSSLTPQHFSVLFLCNQNLPYS